MKELSIVVAMNDEKLIGCQGKIPWRLSSDMKRFATLTKGHPVIMGRKTYESIIERLGRPLSDRTNIILTNNRDFKAGEKCKIVFSFEEAIRVAEKSVGSDEIFVIGGAEIYKLALSKATKMYITHVAYEHIAYKHESDTFFHEYKIEEWKRVFHGEPITTIENPNDEWDSGFSIYERKSGLTAARKLGRQEKFLNLAHARNAQQKDLMQQIKKDGVCPFCREHLEKYHPMPIIEERTWWVATANMSPYEGTRLHLLFIYKNHATMIDEIDGIEFNEAKIELFDMISWAVSEYNIDAGAFFIRFGDTDKTGGTVEHLHAQLIVGETSRTDKNAEGLKVKLGYKRK